MRNFGLLLMTIALLAATASAQQEVAPSTDNGPLLNIKNAPPQPDTDGIYAAGPGIQSPILLHRVAAAYPADAPAETITGIEVLSVVIGADGIPANIQVVQSNGPAFDAAAKEAAKQSIFAPGSLNDKPVPVWVFVQFRFFEDLRTAYPTIGMPNPRNGFSQQSFSKYSAKALSFDERPVPIYQPPAEYSDEARRKKVSGAVLVSLVVTEDGLPTQVQVVKGVGYGLDEKAVQSILRYRFKPATKNGVPVAAPIEIQVTFRAR